MLAGLAALAFSACGSGGPEAAPETAQPGSYTLYGMVRDGEETPDDVIALLAEKGLDCSLILEEDGTGTLVLFGEESKLTWDEKTIANDLKSYPYTMEEGRITLTDGDSSVTFASEESE